MMSSMIMIIGVLAILSGNGTKTNAVPILEKFPVTFELYVKPLGVILFEAELRHSKDTSNYLGEENKGHSHHRSYRSMLDQESPRKPKDDMETAAGTNLLRPLFVYRQQMAYRERNSRKDGRRAAPTY
ncbi:uncharacterized protein LOC107043510 [Diachasma alloeum]|uniref:uncharacterized protein LOC107043510 n=1 Tax=Diachasma alloeum TaxID=454923 RepID=UPI0007383229|nr:uncharacterized protein LOC107043510 [Diachasma alloeum]